MFKKIKFEYELYHGMA